MGQTSEPGELTEGFPVAYYLGGSVEGLNCKEHKDLRVRTTENGFNTEKYKHRKHYIQYSIEHR